MIIAMGMIGYAAILSVLLAYLETQIEGENGYAEKLPCWKKEEGWIVEKLLGGRPLTTYHLALALFVLAVFHMFFFSSPWNLNAELFILGLLLELCVLEDFFWFILNPHFGLKKFKKTAIWWHKSWLGPVPSFYVTYSAGAVILLYIGVPGIS